jgi:aryl-alcohol dehydrogenase-like predicted oxidoreductase
MACDGVNFIDPATMYANGLTEVTLGRILLIERLLRRKAHAVPS